MGKTWKLIQEYVVVFDWLINSVPKDGRELTNMKDNTILSSVVQDNFRNKDQNSALYPEEVQDDNNTVFKQ